jgi:hypothetical protein
MLIVINNECNKSGPYKQKKLLERETNRAVVRGQ